MPRNFAIGCRRATPGIGKFRNNLQVLLSFRLSDMDSGFLEALATDKVTVYCERLREITEDGFVDQEGKKHEVDVIICATG